MSGEDEIVDVGNGTACTVEPAAQLPQTPQRRIIDVNNITVRVKKLKQPIVKNATFFSNEGEILGIIGETGAGKTTILRCLTGQMKPATGTVVVAGIDVIHHRRDAIKRFGYVPQLELVSIYDQFSAIQNVYYFGKMYLSGVPDDAIRTRARELLFILGFKEDLMLKHVAAMSGGEKKRVSIAVGMIHNPDVLLLDEPTTGLDVSLRIQILNYLKNLNKKLGISVVIVSHDLEIAQYCNRIVLLDGGRIIEFGDPEVLISTFLPCDGRAIKLEVTELSEEVLETFTQVPEIKYVIKSGRNDVKIFAENIDREMISKAIEVCDMVGIGVKSITLDRADFTSYYRIRAKLEKERVKKEESAKKELT
jgi:ABC-type multidrug transport system ATPase subunit